MEKQLVSVCMANYYEDITVEMPCDGILVVTHNGVFHADDVVASALIGVVLQHNLYVVRTRDQRWAAKGKPFGNIYDPWIFDVFEGELDHHGSALKRNGECWPGVPHSAVTLVASKLFPEGLEKHPVLHKALAAIAAQDNGVACPPELAGEHRFGFVRDFIPSWDDPRPDFGAAFCSAVLEAQRPLIELLKQDAAAIRAAAVVEALPRDAQIVEIPGGLPGWAEALVPSSAVYVVYKAEDDTWRIQCVPATVEDRFSKKLALPAEWAGKRSEELSAASGIDGAVFCHVGRFIAGWQTKEQALAAAKSAMP